MKSILDRVTVGSIGRPDVHDQVVAVTDEEVHKQVQETDVQARAAPHMCVNLCVTDRVATLWEDPILTGP